MTKPMHKRNKWKHPVAWNSLLAACCTLAYGVASAQTRGNTSTVTIVDDDPPPSVAFSASTQSLPEGNSGTTNVTVTVNLSAASGKNINVPYTVSGSGQNPGDHNAVGANLPLSAGSTSGSIVFQVVGETVSEPNETVVFTLGTPTNATKGTPAVHTVTIQDDDPQAVDTVPDPFQFTDRNSVTRNALITSNIVTITGLTGAAVVTITGGGNSLYSIGCTTTFTSGQGSINNNQTVCVRHTSASDYESTVATQLTIGGVTDVWYTTTRANPDDECNPICP